MQNTLSLAFSFLLSFFFSLLLPAFAQTLTYQSNLEIQKIEAHIDTRVVEGIC